MHDISKFITDQLSIWPEVAARFRSLKTASQKIVRVFGLDCRVQFNPCRIASSTAETDARTISERPCFLCAANCPTEQTRIPFSGRKHRDYFIQINPFPIFPGHLVIVRDAHIPQEIWHHFPDMLKFVQDYPDYSVFYNGPASGASAPDHLHFQGVPRHLMPLEEAVDAFLDAPDTEPLDTVRDASLYLFRGFTHGVFALKADTPKSMAKLFYRLLDCTGMAEDGGEPPFNLFAFSKNGEYRAFVTMRSAPRSHHYYAEGDDKLSMSPGAADMAGVLVAPVRHDFDYVDSQVLEEMLAEVSISEAEECRICERLTRREQMIDVGILSAKEIEFEIISDGAGVQRVRWQDGRIDYNGTLYDELYFDAMTHSTLFEQPSFILHDVVIGIDFHWQQKRTLQFAGALKFIVEGDKIVAVNHIGVENYLLSVISSEMKASSSLELLKAHAVISRSWLMRNLGRHGAYDVCADDHCQRYQGIPVILRKPERADVRICRSIENTSQNDEMEPSPSCIRKAIDETWGQLLMHDGEICDARYSKCCGGRTERFSACWEDVDYPYLTPVDDTPAEGGRAFCDCEDSAILSQVLNDYDTATRDFFRWQVRYTQDELSRLFAQRTGLGLGTITALEPLERGDSGRIVRLRVVGTEGEAVIGKELAIRRALSDSHLKSSAFEVSRDGTDFILDGHGWGHGVGLCQIGAAVMASQGYGYREILAHYYKGATVE